MKRVGKIFSPHSLSSGSKMKGDVVLDSPQERVGEDLPLSQSTERTAILNDTSGSNSTRGSSQQDEPKKSKKGLQKYVHKMNPSNLLSPRGNANKKDKATKQSKKPRRHSVSGDGLLDADLATFSVSSILDANNDNNMPQLAPLVGGPKEGSVRRLQVDEEQRLSRRLSERLSMSQVQSANSTRTLTVGVLKNTPTVEAQPVVSSRSVTKLAPNVKDMRRATSRRSLMQSQSDDDDGDNDQESQEQDVPTPPLPRKKKDRKRLSMPTAEFVETESESIPPLSILDLSNAPTKLVIESATHGTIETTMTKEELMSPLVTKVVKRLSNGNLFICAKEVPPRQNSTDRKSKDFPSTLPLDSGTTINSPPASNRPRRTSSRRRLTTAAEDKDVEDLPRAPTTNRRASSANPPTVRRRRSIDRKKSRTTAADDEPKTQRRKSKRPHLLPVNRDERIAQMEADAVRGVQKPTHRRRTIAASSEQPPDFGGRRMPDISEPAIPTQPKVVASRRRKTSAGAVMADVSEPAIPTHSKFTNARRRLSGGHLMADGSEPVHTKAASNRGGKSAVEAANTGEPPKEPKRTNANRRRKSGTHVIASDDDGGFREPTIKANNTRSRTSGGPVTSVNVALMCDVSELLVAKSTKPSNARRRTSVTDPEEAVMVDVSEPTIPTNTQPRRKSRRAKSMSRIPEPVEVAPEAKLAASKSSARKQLSRESKVSKSCAAEDPPKKKTTRKVQKHRDSGLQRSAHVSISASEQCPNLVAISSMESPSIGRRTASLGDFSQDPALQESTRRLRPPTAGHAIMPPKQNSQTSLGYRSVGLPSSGSVADQELHSAPSNSPPTSREVLARNKSSTQLFQQNFLVASAASIGSSHHTADTTTTPRQRTVDQNQSSGTVPLGKPLGQSFKYPSSDSIRPVSKLSQRPPGKQRRAQSMSHYNSIFQDVDPPQQQPSPKLKRRTQSLTQIYSDSDCQWSAVTPMPDPVSADVTTKGKEDPSPVSVVAEGGLFTIDFSHPASDLNESIVCTGLDSIRWESLLTEGDWPKPSRSRARRRMTLNCDGRDYFEADPAGKDNGLSDACDSVVLAKMNKPSTELKMEPMKQLTKSLSDSKPLPSLASFQASDRPTFGGDESVSANLPSLASFQTSDQTTDGGKSVATPFLHRPASDDDSSAMPLPSLASYQTWDTRRTTGEHSVSTHLPSLASCDLSDAEDIDSVGELSEIFPKTAISSHLEGTRVKKPLSGACDSVVLFKALKSRPLMRNPLVAQEKDKDKGEGETLVEEPAFDGDMSKFFKATTISKHFKETGRKKKDLSDACDSVVLSKALKNRPVLQKPHPGALRRRSMGDDTIYREDQALNRWMNHGEVNHSPQKPRKTFSFESELSTPCEDRFINACDSVLLAQPTLRGHLAASSQMEKGNSKEKLSDACDSVLLVHAVKGRKGHKEAKRSAIGRVPHRSLGFLKAKKSAGMVGRGLYDTSPRMPPRRSFSLESHFSSATPAPRLAAPRFDPPLDGDIGDLPLDDLEKKGVNNSALIALEENLTQGKSSDDREPPFRNQKKHRNSNHVSRQGSKSNLNGSLDFKYLHQPTPSPTADGTSSWGQTSLHNSANHTNETSLTKEDAYNRWSASL